MPGSGLAGRTNKKFGVQCEPHVRRGVPSSGVSCSTVAQAGVQFHCLVRHAELQAVSAHSTIGNAVMGCRHREGDGFRSTVGKL